MARITIINGEDAGESFVINDEIVIGRSVHSQITIPDRLISRRNSYIRKQGEVYIIEDLASRNGTKVNGQPIDSSALKEGDEIQIGQTILKFSYCENKPSSPELTPT